MALENCIYCGKHIDTRSREHVIQNALGGLYESTDICCPECNNYVSKYIDAPFTRVFNPIISRIENFSKTNNTKSQPACNGMTEYNGKQYPAIIKAGRVVGCPELARELKCDISKLNLKIISYDFQVSNTEFQNGIAKIAFNYALDSGIDPDILTHGLDVKKTATTINSIKFKYPMVPFVALNPVDKRIELNTPVDLYHNMILFNTGPRLWCYVDLFNTFQYYILLSEKFDCTTTIHRTYIQSLQKIDRTMPKLYISSPKDIYTYAMEYNIEPCMDIELFKSRIMGAIARKSQKKEMSDIINTKIHQAFRFPYDIKNDEMKSFWRSMHLYMDDCDHLRSRNFRILTPSIDGTDLYVYPDLITGLIQDNGLDFIRPYTMAKFDRLNNYLRQNSK